ncbi:MAG: NAD(P)H-binding protein [Chloroflexota bacterium]
MTGATGFVGRALLRRLTQAGLEVRTLLRPSPRSPDLPRGVPVEVALAALSDARGLRAAMVGVDIVFHLASGERAGARHLAAADVQGTQNVAEAAADAGVRRLIFLSHLGADRTSAYPLLRAKAQAEEAIRRSGLPFTIVRTAVLFGEGDHFTSWLAMLLAISPLVLPIPGDGSTMLQPLWVEDLATCLAWALDDPATIDQTYEIGGPEFLTLHAVIHMVMQETGIRRILLPTRTPYLRLSARLLRRLLPRSPVNDLWLDHFTVSHMAELSTLPRAFGLQPSRMEQRLGYLRGRNWGWDLLAAQFSPRHEVSAWLSRS